MTLSLAFITVHAVLVILQCFARFVFGRTALGVVTLAAIALPVTFWVWALSALTSNGPAVVVATAVGVGWVIASALILVGACLVFAAMKDLSATDK